jgi:hypothetical protein
MTRFKVGVLLAVLSGLVLTGIAVADAVKPSRVPVAAHFTATGSIKTTSCTTSATAGGSTAATTSFSDAHAQLAGTATSADKRLNGAARVNLRLIVNSNGDGIARGTFRVVNKVVADVYAVVSGSNRLDGFLRSASGGKRLFANFSATLSGSSLTGDIGSGSHLNTAVIGGSGCAA